MFVIYLPIINILFGNKNYKTIFTALLGIICPFFTTFDRNRKFTKAFLVFWTGTGKSKRLSHCLRREKEIPPKKYLAVWEQETMYSRTCCNPAHAWSTPVISSSLKAAGKIIMSVYGFQFHYLICWPYHLTGYYNNK